MGAGSKWDALLNVTLPGVCCVCVMGRAENQLCWNKTLKTVTSGASAFALSLYGWVQSRCLHSPWFVVPGSDRILSSKNRNTQYFPPEHIVESDTSALWTKTLHRLLSSSPKWEGEEVSWKRLLEIVPVSRLWRSLSDPQELFISSYFLIIYFQPSIPNPSMWRGSDRRYERSAIAHKIPGDLSCSKLKN